MLALNTSVVDVVNSVTKGCNIFYSSVFRTLVAPSYSYLIKLSMETNTVRMEWGCRWDCGILHLWLIFHVWSQVGVAEAQERGVGRRVGWRLLWADLSCSLKSGPPTPSKLSPPFPRSWVSASLTRDVRIQCQIVEQRFVLTSTCTCFAKKLSKRKHMEFWTRLGLVRASDCASSDDLTFVRPSLMFIARRVRSTTSSERELISVLNF